MLLNSTRYSTVWLWIFLKKFLDQQQVVVKNYCINHRPFLVDVREDERNRLTFILQFNSNFHGGLNCDLHHLNLKITLLRDNPVSAFQAKIKAVYLSVFPCVYQPRPHLQIKSQGKAPWGRGCLFMAHPLSRALVRWLYLYAAVICLET